MILIFAIFQSFLNVSLILGVSAASSAMEFPLGLKIGFCIGSSGNGMVFKILLSRVLAIC